MAERDRPLYAVLIDGDNVPPKYAEGILKEITSFAEPALRKVYGDMSSDNLQGWIAAVRDHGIVAQQETANIKGKNASDIGMVIDAMDILHGGRLDGFVIVSSDSDFTRLASRIREHGLHVIGMGEIKTHESFKNACQRFIYLENTLEVEESDLIRVADAPIETDQKQGRNPTEIIPLIRRALKNADPDGTWVKLGPLKNNILAEKSDFDHRSYGAQKFSDLLKTLKGFEVKMVDGQLHARWKV